MYYPPLYHVPWLYLHFLSLMHADIDIMEMERVGKAYPSERGKVKWSRLHLYFEGVDCSYAYCGYLDLNASRGQCGLPLAPVTHSASLPQTHALYGNQMPSARQIEEAHKPPTESSGRFPKPRLSTFNFTHLNSASEIETLPCQAPSTVSAERSTTRAFHDSLWLSMGRTRNLGQLHFQLKCLKYLTLGRTNLDQHPLISTYRLPSPHHFRQILSPQHPSPLLIHCVYKQVT